MSDPDIDDTIAALRREIALIDADSGSRARLEALADALAERRQHDETPSGAPSLSDAVRDMVRTHESRHPQVTLLLNDLATRLAGMGI